MACGYYPSRALWSMAVSSWARAVSPVMATLLSVGIILRVGSRPAQLFFHAARERMTAQNPPATQAAMLGHEAHCNPLCFFSGEGCKVWWV